jgi:hypothetical protein
MAREKDRTPGLMLLLNATPTNTFPGLERHDGTDDAEDPDWLDWLGFCDRGGVVLLRAGAGLALAGVGAGAAVAGECDTATGACDGDSLTPGREGDEGTDAGTATWLSVKEAPVGRPSDLT